MSTTMAKTPVTSPISTSTMAAGVTSTGNTAQAKAKACAALHVQLIGSQSLSRLYGDSLASVAAGARQKLSPDIVKGTQFDQDKLNAALAELAAAGSGSLSDIIGQPMSALSAPLLKAVGDARKAGLALPAPVNDPALIARRQSALRQLLADAPGVTVQDLGSPAAVTAMSTVARVAVRNAQATGVLPADKTPVPPVTAVATLANCQITFDTNDEDKDDDTHVLVSVVDANNVLAAQISSDFVHFDDHSSHGPYSLQILNPSARTDLVRGHVTIQINPNGHDTWRFNYELDLIFSDGTHLSGSEADNQLTQDDRTLTMGIQGLIPNI